MKNGNMSNYICTIEAIKLQATIDVNFAFARTKTRKLPAI